MRGIRAGYSQEVISPVLPWKVEYVVSLWGVRIVIFLAELNGLKIWQTDIGNAYLEATTEEKVYVITGPEFGEKEGHNSSLTRRSTGSRLAASGGMNVSLTYCETWSLFPAGLNPTYG